ncbi:MAG: hypothetical protein K6F93_04445 [Lachnospiraceae bacterium]|nr:hypothetical protein [Lachnospiraceae bacterium]
MKNLLKKLISFGLVFVLISGIFVSVPVQAKEKKTDTAVSEDLFSSASQLQSIYVGQKLRLVFTYDGKIIKYSKIKWSIPEGKDYVKLLNKGKYYKGIKPGKAIIRAKYNNRTFDYQVEVLPKTTVKAQTIEALGQSLNIPKNLVLLGEQNGAVVYNSTKNELAVIINVLNAPVNFDSLSDEQWDAIDVSMGEQIKNMDLSSLIQYDTSVEDAMEFEIKDHGFYVGKQAFKINNIGTYYCAIVYILDGDYMKLFSVVSLNKDVFDENVEYIIANN